MGTFKPAEHHGHSPRMLVSLIFSKIFIILLWHQSCVCAYVHLFSFMSSECNVNELITVSHWQLQALEGDGLRGQHQRANEHTWYNISWLFSYVCHSVSTCTDVAPCGPMWEKCWHAVCSVASLLSVVTSRLHLACKFPVPFVRTNKF